MIYAGCGHFGIFPIRAIRCNARGPQVNQPDLFPRATIDTDSAPGAWLDALRFPCSYRTILLSPLEALDARLALRKAARLEHNPHRRGHITRKINAGAK